MLMAAGVAVLCVGCERSAGSAGAGAANGHTSRPLLVEVTSQAGIDFVHDPVRTGNFLFPEINGAGCAFLDYNNDGLLDIYLVQSGRDLRHPEAPGKPNKLYRNQGDGTFVDVTVASGAGDTGYGQGVACGDYDNNGFVDLYVANVGGPSALLRNNGDGTFANVTERAGVANGAWCIVPAFLDYDNDGFLDLIATNYVEWSVEQDKQCRGATGKRDYCSPLSYSPAPPVLYHNNGDGTFTDVSAASGINLEYGAGMGVVTADFNDDSLVDIYVANDAFANQLWINQGDGTFVNEAPEAGCAVSARGSALSSMGTNVEDFDGDGDLDLFTTNYHAQGSILYLQEDGRFFTDVSIRTGLYRETAPRTGFGACFFDLFNDGGLCVYIGNGAAVMGGAVDAETDVYAQRDSVLRWSDKMLGFSDLTGIIGPAMDPAYVSRGVAVGDYDNDGAVDVLISCNNGPARLLRNTAAPASAHWLMVRVLSPDGRRDALGAKVFVTVVGKTRRRDLIVNYSYASASDARLHFGLGSHGVADRVMVEWPGGMRATWDSVPADQVFVARYPVIEPEPQTSSTP